eukprot:TRINITY_DN11828_c0_g1_i2.p1 TRINITY_DN11828_c0_g1~~TRINITY_DN11828_c0_g1_i2.p1  ORF type:complete len:169 (+),score=39.29 TRINITY_DN11828_c0_g1_i2:79-585(+)
MEVGGKKRLRERKDKSRSLDETTRARILAKRLDHLEDDTLSDGDWNTGKEEDAFLDEARGLKRTKPKKKKKRKTSSKAQQVEKSHLFRYRTKAKSINQIIAEERVNKGLTTPPPILTCLSAPCSYPATKYCSVCRFGSHTLLKSSAFGFLSTHDPFSLTPTGAMRSCE